MLLIMLSEMAVEDAAPASPLFHQEMAITVQYLHITSASRQMKSTRASVSFLTP